MSEAEEIAGQVLDAVRFLMQGIVAMRVYPDDEAAELIGFRGAQRAREIRALPIPQVPITRMGRKIGYLGRDLIQWVEKNEAVDQEQERNVAPPKEIVAPAGLQVCYFVRATEHELVKIGTSSNLNERLTQLRNTSPIPIKLIGYLPNKGRQYERSLHERFAGARSHGEWFKLTEELAGFIQEKIRECATQDH